MSFVPQMQNYFGKDTNFTKMSSAYGDAGAYGMSALMQGDDIREQAKARAEMRIMAGEHALSQGQNAGSAAVTGGFISGIGDLAGGFLQGGLKDGGFLRGGGNHGDPGTFGDGAGTGHTDYSWNANPKNYEPGSISSPGWSWSDL